MTKKIQVISPSGSISNLNKNKLDDAENFYNDIFNIEISYGQHINEIDDFFSSSIKSRINDLETAFSDSSLDLIHISSGGDNCNQLLNKINYKNFKDIAILGKSDSTSLLNAIYTLNRTKTFYGPNFKSLGKLKNSNFTKDWFKKFLSNENKEWLKVYPSDIWWDKGEKINNTGHWLINNGEAEGVIIGGNLPTLTLLQGTSYMPNIKDKILFLEYDGLVGEFVPGEFDRDLESLLQQKNADKIKGIVLGRFTSNSSMTEEKLKKIIKNKPILKDIPIIANVDFGHTNPSIIVPIGGSARIENINNTGSLFIKF